MLFQSSLVISYQIKQQGYYLTHSWGYFGKKLFISLTFSFIKSRTFPHNQTFLFVFYFFRRRNLQYSCCLQLFLLLQAVSQLSYTIVHTPSFQLFQVIVFSFDRKLLNPSLHSILRIIAKTVSETFNYWNKLIVTMWIVFQDSLIAVTTFFKGKHQLNVIRVKGSLTLKEI